MRLLQDEPWSACLWVHSAQCKTELGWALAGGSMNRRNAGIGGGQAQSGVPGRRGVWERTVGMVEMRWEEMGGTRTRPALVVLGS